MLSAVPPTSGALEWPASSSISTDGAHTGIWRGPVVRVGDAGWPHCRAAFISGADPNTVGEVCDAVVPAVATALGINAGEPVRDPLPQSAGQRARNVRSARAAGRLAARVGSGRADARRTVDHTAATAQLQPTAVEVHDLPPDQASIIQRDCGPPRDRRAGGCEPSNCASFEGPTLVPRVRGDDANQ